MLHHKSIDIFDLTHVDLLKISENELSLFKLINFEKNEIKETTIQESDDIKNLGLVGMQSEAFDKFVDTFGSVLIDGGKYKNTYKTDNPRDYYLNDNKKIKLHIQSHNRR